VRYPLDDLTGILALESTRARCTVIGEDLGTVPAGFRERMAGTHVLSYRVLFFERDSEGEHLLLVELREIPHVTPDPESSVGF